METLEQVIAERDALKRELELVKVWYTPAVVQALVSDNNLLRANQRQNSEACRRLQDLCDALVSDNERLRADQKQNGKDYCKLIDRHDALFVELAKLQDAAEAVQDSAFGNENDELWHVPVDVLDKLEIVLEKLRKQ